MADDRKHQTPAKDVALEATAASGENVALEATAASDNDVALDATSADRGAADGARSGNVIRPPRSHEPARGDSIGKFIVIDRVGAGGMGVVLSAYDPDLDRKVALKLLRADGAGSEGGGRGRLLREAQAMARLAHPNVITVLEVGTVDERVFVAMEFVEGGTLRKHLEGTWRDKLGLYVQAGRGLAAAHAAGMVHRDFKPDNVLVTVDGTVKVTDFGLVSMAGVREAGTGDTKPTLSELTRTGSIMGTPAYMAPEQHAGESVDARADQFAFCVSLYEALYGERPFAGASYDELVKNVLAGKLSPAPRADVPAWLRRALVRGLSPEPRDRFASMDELLVELAYERRARKRRTIAVAAGFVAVAGASAGAMMYMREPPPVAASPCDGADELAATAWNPTVRKAMQDAFARSGGALGAEAFTRAAGALDTYTAEWVEQRTEACKATRVRGDQTEALLDKRMYCFDGHLAQTRALATLFGKADKQLVSQAIELVSSLPEHARCSDVEALTAAYPPPSDPAERERAKQLQERVVDLEVLLGAGRYHELKAAAPALIADARKLKHPPLLATAVRVYGAALHSLGEAEAAMTTLREAASLAATARDDEGIAYAYGQLYYIADGLQNRAAEAAAMRPFIDVAFARAGEKGMARGTLLEVDARRARAAGKFDEAAAMYKSAIALYESTKQHTRIPVNQVNLALVLRDQGKLDEALALLEKAEKLATEKFTEKSPVTARVTASIGGTLVMKGDIAGAIARLERALVVQEDMLGPSTQEVAETLTLLGISLLKQSLNERAIEKLEKARDVYRAANGPDHMNVAFPVANLGEIHMQMGDCVRARESYLEAQRIWEKTLGAKHPIVGQLVGQIAICDARLGNNAAAHAGFVRALEIISASQGPKTTTYANVLSNRAQLWSREGKHAQALAEFQRAIDIFSAVQGNSIETIDAKFRRAEALVLAGKPPAALAELEALLEAARKAGNDRVAADVELLLASLLPPTAIARAKQLAQSAEARYVKVGAGGKAGHERATAWLKAHP